MKLRKKLANVILLAVAVYCIVEGAICYLVLSHNHGYILTFLFGLALLCYVVWQTQIWRFFSVGWGRHIKWPVYIAAAVGAGGFVLFVTLTLTVSLNRPDDRQDDRPVMIVLGTGLQGDRVTTTLAARLEKAREYYLDHPQTKIVVSGGQGPNETVSEAAAMAEYLISRGISSKNLILEDQSTSTVENFVFSKKILDEMFGGQTYKVVFVTNRFHAFRSGHTAKKAGLDATCLAAASKPVFMLPNFYFREYLALIVTLITYR
jgi:uncharacterized SAM-binding protein YcdF (DUF218 family)